MKICACNGKKKELLRLDDAEFLVRQTPYLPNAPGDQVFKTAKQIDPDLNVIVVRGYPDSEILDRILQVSPVTVLKKPLKLEQLTQAEVLGKKFRSFS